jgi:hypothetical protein
MRDDRPIGQLECRQLRRARRIAQRFPRTLAQEGNRAAVTRDHLVVFDACGAERLLHPATRMDPRAAVISVTDEQRRYLGHLVLRFKARDEPRLTPRPADHVPRTVATTATRPALRCARIALVGIEQAVDELNGDYTGSARAYGPYIRHILDMADMISGGIVRQFPARFR